MSSFVLGSLRYNELLIFVWTACGPHGESEAAFAIDGRDYGSARRARAAVREALEQTDRRVPVAEFRPVGIREETLKELACWPSWAEFRRCLDVYGPVYPHPRRRWSEPPTRAVPLPTPVTVPRTPLYSGRHFDCWGQLVETFPKGEGPYDPVLGRVVEGYGLNSYTGEFEADTRRALQVAHGFEDDETWPMRDEDEFIAVVELRREQLLRTSFFQRHDKPGIFAAYEQAVRDGQSEQSRRATYEMWRQVHRRRAYFLVGAEPVRVDLVDDGTPTTAWRLDLTTGRLVPSGGTDAETVVTGKHRRITEHVWLLAVEDIRRTLDVDGAIADAYAKAAAEPDWGYRRRILTHSFDLWAEKFAGNEAGQ